MKKNQKASINDVLFLAIGVVLLSVGYSIISSIDTDYLISTNAKWWGFGATLLGGLILGKWISDFFLSKAKKKR